MSTLFDRRIELHVYTTLYAGGQKTIIKTDHKNHSLDIEFSTEASARRGKKPVPNTAKITVINLSEDNRNLFEESHQAIEFYAGYKNDFGMIFVGNTVNVTNTYDEAKNRWLTTIYALDGGLAWATKFFNKSYSAGTAISQILQDMVDATGLPSTIDTLDIDTLLSGESYSGLVKDVLSKLCLDRGLEWSIQWGVIEVTQKDSPLLKDPLVEILRSDTGMLGKPALIDRTTKDKKKTTKEKREFGVRVTSLLNHRIRPRRLIKIESPKQVTAVGKLSTEQAPKRDVNGTYIVESCKFTGSNFGKEFYVEIEANLE